MLQADEDLLIKASGAQMVLLYYAGHGLQIEGVPYLVPVDLPQPNKTLWLFNSYGRFTMAQYKPKRKDQYNYSHFTLKISMRRRMG